MWGKISGDGAEADCNFTVPTLTGWEGSDSLPVNLAYSGQLRQPQVTESIAKGKNLLVIVPIIFVRQHFCYFYYTCMSS